MRTVVSTSGTPAYVISKYLVKVIECALIISQLKIKNSVQFANEARSWKISPT